MDIKKKSYQRHFAYQHPTFGTKNRPKPESAWKKSIYYWWWAYLKRNKEYLACCEKSGQGKLSCLYADFGDVRGDDFKAWWSEDGRGVKVFAEPRAEDSIRVLAEGERALSIEETLTISLPLSLPKRFIERRFRELLAQSHQGKRGIQLAKQSKAKYKIQGQINIPAIKQALEVYDYWVANPQLKLWEIGNQLPKFQIVMKIKKGDTPASITHSKNVLAATVSRYLRRVKESITSTNQGLFP